MRGATIVYATHIFDGLEGWLTHLAFISQGKLLKGTPYLAHITSCLFCTTSCLLDITSCLLARGLQLTLDSAVHKAALVQRRHSEQQPLPKPSVGKLGVPWTSAVNRRLKHHLHIYVLQTSICRHVRL